MKQWKGPVQDSAQEPPPPPPTSPASSCSALPPEARLGPLQSPLGLNQTADLASITRDADFEFLSESTAPRPGTGGTPSISDKLMNELERAEPLVVINANIHLSWIHGHWAPLCWLRASRTPGLGLRRSQPQTPPPDPTQKGGTSSAGSPRDCRPSSPPLRR